MSSPLGIQFEGQIFVEKDMHIGCSVAHAVFWTLSVFFECVVKTAVSGLSKCWALSMISCWCGGRGITECKQLMNMLEWMVEESGCC